MSNPRSCPMGHTSLQAQLGHLDGAAMTLAVASQTQARRSAVPPGDRRHGLRPAAPAVGGWWAYCAQASSVEA